MAIFSIAVKSALTVDPSMIQARGSLVPRPSEGEEREGLVLTACACATFPGIFRKNVRKSRRPRARKSFTEQVHGEPRALLV